MRSENSAQYTEDMTETDQQAITRLEETLRLEWAARAYCLEQLDKEQTDHTAAITALHTSYCDDKRKLLDNISYLTHEIDEKDDQAQQLTVELKQAKKEKEKLQLYHTSNLHTIEQLKSRLSSAQNVHKEMVLKSALPGAKRGADFPE